jgi:predicted helicase
MTQPQDQVFDPGVGTGTFLTRAHERIRSTSPLSHEDILGNLWAVDISAFPAELAVLNLCRLDLTSADNFPRVAVRDFFTLKPGERLSFPPAKRHAGSTQQVVLPLPQFDSVIGNPPYVRSQQLDDLEASYKAHLHGLAKRVGVGQDSKFDAYVYYFLHATQFLKDGGRIGFVTSAAWLTSGYGAQLQRFMLDHFQPVLILWSEVEPFFPNQGVDTVVTILEKLTSAERKTARGSIRFVTFTDTLDNLLPPDGSLDYWTIVPNSPRYWASHMLADARP